ncbi:unnamed protein product [Zymoseptoria tritici ST99CH_3D7]|uniref:Calcineurin-like phosphoesterase domain-containing protein n=1 Tax=Zymoseptoria tritici (strain ST99CH_3D7) TaxID=1276538 RepID=A0A1X7RNK3_ZYMT9|nr:unnamed protein product [Zymoseptoria tritici ST99CH_3D7]
MSTTMPNPYEIPSIRRQLYNPTKLIARLISYLFSLLHSDHKTNLNITVICISDTHTLIPTFIPPGDILIHAGDLTNAGTPAELQAQIDHLSSLPHRYKITIAGNHDTYLDPASRKTLSPADQAGSVDWKDIIYLQNSSTTLDFSDRTSRNHGRVKVFGSPHVPLVGGPEHAFQYPREEDMWTGKIPQDADIVVTHGPPRFHLDLPGVRAMGDPFLLREVRRTKPLLHVFGHIHAGRSDVLGILRGGQEDVRWDESERALAAVLGRESNERVWGLVSSWKNVVDCYHLLIFVVSGIVALLQHRVLGHEVPSTRMVNAALTYCNTGKLGNKPQVVEL